MKLIWPALAICALFVTAPAEAQDNPDCRLTKPPNVRIAACTRALKKDGGDPESARIYLSFRATGYRDLKRYDEAIADLTQAIKLRNDEFDYADRAIIYRLMKKYDLALADINFALRARPHSVGFLGDRALIYEEAGQLDRAITDVEAQLAEKPLSEVEPKIRANLERLRRKQAGART